MCTAGGPHGETRSVSRRPGPARKEAVDAASAPSAHMTPRNRFHRHHAKRPDMEPGARHPCCIMVSYQRNSDGFGISELAPCRTATTVQRTERVIPPASTATTGPRMTAASPDRKRHCTQGGIRRGVTLAMYRRVNPCGTSSVALTTRALIAFDCIARNSTPRRHRSRCFDESKDLRHGATDSDVGCGTAWPAAYRDLRAWRGAGRHCRHRSRFQPTRSLFYGLRKNEVQLDALESAPSSLRVAVH